MVEASAPQKYSADADTTKLIHVATLVFQVTPFRAERLARAYLPAVAMVMDYGSSGYAFYRGDAEPDKFTHVSYWEDKKDCEQWWFGRPMQDIRQEINGIYELPAMPTWHTLLERG